MTVDWKKKLIPNLPYLLFVYLFDKLCQAVRLAPGLDASEKFLHLSQGFTEAFSSGLPSLHPLDLLAGIAGAVIVRLAVYAKSKNTKKYRKGIEYGSARWGTAADIAPYSISFATRRTTCTAAGCPSMCGASWTSSPISGRYPTSTS